MEWLNVFIGGRWIEETSDEWWCGIEVNRMYWNRNHWFHIYSSFILSCVVYSNIAIYRWVWFILFMFLIEWTFITMFQLSISVAAIWIWMNWSTKMYHLYEIIESSTNPVANCRLQHTISNRSCVLMSLIILRTFYTLMMCTIA